MLLRCEGLEPPMSQLVHKRTLRRVQTMSALPPKADIAGRQLNVRFVPKGDIAGHSISSSARITTDCGSVRPNAFAALMPITISNLVGCSTGRSPGFEPLKIILT
jgi:hypothetical protein